MRTLLVVLTFTAPLAFAQTDETSARGTAPAAAASERPGDEALTCEQIRAELDSIIADPAALSALAQQQEVLASAAGAIAAHPEGAPALSTEALTALGGATADRSEPQAITPAAEDTQSEQDATPRRGGKLRGLGRAAAGGVSGALGGSRAASAAQQRQIEQMGAAGRAAQEAQQPTMQALQAQTAAAAPQFMRGMRLAQLAEAKHCGDHDN